MSDKTAVLIRILNDGFADIQRRLAALDTAGAFPGKDDTNPHTIPAEQVDACKSPEVAAKDKAKRSAKAKPAAEVATEPELSPEQIAADLKAKLVALVGKDRAKAVAILGTVGAKNFSTIPVEKHNECLRKVNDALNPKPEDDDPLA